MTIDQMAKILQEMRERAPRGEVAIQAILFGIEHRARLDYMDRAELSRLATGGPDTCTVEIEYGMKLAPHVRLRE